MNVIISIVIPVKNEQGRIAELIQRIKTFNVFGTSPEVILLDNGSDDDTVKVASQFADIVKIFPKLKIGELRNAGVEIASGDYVGFIDADCWPDLNFGEVAVEFLNENDNVGIVGGDYLMGKNPTWVEELWFEYRETRTKNTSFIPAGNCVVRRNEFLKIGGFPLGYQTGEDYALCQKYRDFGKKVFKLEALNTIHFGNSKTIKQIFFRELWYGRTIFLFIKKLKISKSIIFTLISSIGSLGFIMTMSLYALFDHFYFVPFLLSFLFLILPPLLYSSYVVFENKKFGNFLKYNLIFFAYFAGRTLSLFFVSIGLGKLCKK